MFVIPIYSDMCLYKISYFNKIKIKIFVYKKLYIEKSYKLSFINKE